MAFLTPNQIGACSVMSCLAHLLRVNFVGDGPDLDDDEAQDIVQLLNEDSQVLVDLLKGMHKLGRVDVEAFRKVAGKAMTTKGANKWLQLLKELAQPQ